MMTRNTEKKRVEVVRPVYDETIRKQLTHMLKIMLADNVKARELKSDGKYYMKEKGNFQKSIPRNILCVKQSPSDIRKDGQNKASLIKSGRFFRRK